MTGKSMLTETSYLVELWHDAGDLDFASLYIVVACKMIYSWPKCLRSRLKFLKVSTTHPVCGSKNVNQQSFNEHQLAGPTCEIAIDVICELCASFC